MQEKNKKKFMPSGTYFSDIEEPLKVIKENSVQELSFNIMPNRTVTEKLYIHEYRIGDASIEVYFDREYYSQMAFSPDHLIFLSSQIQFQKLIYVYMCYYLGFSYDPFSSERIKIWPTRIDCKVPRMIRNNKAIKQSLFIESIETRGKGIYFATATTVVNNTMVIYGEANVYVLGSK
jgi:hypothetical protein